jgi:hypothetical protein
VKPSVAEAEAQTATGLGIPREMGAQSASKVTPHSGANWLFLTLQAVSSIRISATGFESSIGIYFSWLVKRERTALQDAWFSSKNAVWRSRR